MVSGDSDGQLKFWHFSEKSNYPLSKQTLASGITLFRSHSESGLLAIALDDFDVVVLDCETSQIIRKFSGHRGRITDTTFSADSRWLITASMDGTVKVWDIPSSYLIDHFSFESPCISLSMSPTGDFLATAHVDRLGIFTWSNKSLFSYVPLKSIDVSAHAPRIDLPSTVEVRETEKSDDDEEGDSAVSNYQSPPQIDSRLITMSALAASRWQNLLTLDIVKQRNRPKQPLKTPKRASFFLPTVAGLDFQFDLSSTGENGQNEEEKSKIIRAENFSNLTKFGQLLDRSVKSDRFEECVEHLKLLGPSMIDFELKSLAPEGGGNVVVMEQFMKMLVHMFKTRTNFELAQSYLSVFLREHGRFVVDTRKLRAHLRTIADAQNHCWSQLEKNFIYGIAVSSESRLFAS